MQTPTRNLRILLWQSEQRRKPFRLEERLGGWAKSLSMVSGLSIGRCEELLLGESPTHTEIQTIAKAYDVTDDWTQGNPLERSNLFKENLRFLVQSLEYGEHKLLAVNRSTLSRWASGESQPTERNLKTLVKKLGLPDATDLTNEPLFLSIEPLSTRQMRDWVARRIQELDSSYFRAIYPALRVLLSKVEE